MRISLKNTTYKGLSDSTSLTDDRCKQILAVYEHTQSLGKKMMNYKDLQQEVASSNLFGGQTIGESAVRTIFPLLSKIGFVDYSGHFYACDLFTKMGVVFIETYSALYHNEDYSNVKLQDELEYCLSLIQQYGLLIMNEQESYKEHGFWLACSILKEEKEIYWSEFLYLLYLTKEQNLSLKEALSIAKENRNKGVSYEYHNSDNKAIANTSFSYIHSYLTEAGLIRDKDQKCSILISSKMPFIEELIL